MSVLVDTSIWIRFLSNQTPFAEALDRLLADNAVAGHDFVYGELLAGDRGDRGDRQKLLRSCERMEWILSVPHGDVVTFARARRILGRGIGWVDAHLLASALVGGFRLRTTDRQLAAVADELGIGYHIEDSGSDPPASGSVS